MFFDMEKVDKLKRPIVFTNGCYDLFHYGHLYALRKAKEFGESLVVAVNSNRRTSQTANECHAGIAAYHSRGVEYGPCAAIYGVVNRGNTAGIVGTSVGPQGADSGDPIENQIGILCRNAPFVVGDPWHNDSADNDTGEAVRER